MDIKYYSCDSAENLYSEAVIVNGVVFLSGIVSEDMETGELLLGDITHETNTILNNVKKLLSKYRSGMERVIKVEVYLRDYKDIDQMNEAYIKHFSNGKRPARFCAEVGNLYAQCKVEMVVTALQD